MIGRTNVGGGGASLNFKVVGGTSAPASPKENTIWVNTSTTITDWVFSATQPTGATGRVWISTGTSSTVEFNALKKNNIAVYPLTAKQYVSGAWVDKEAKSYQNGAWVDWWNGELYEYGNEYEGVTGGWSADSNSNGTVTFNTNNIYLAGRDGDTYTVAGTVNSIDLSKYTKLVIKGTKIGEHYNGGCFHAGVASARGRSNDIVSVESKHTGDLLLEIDISSVDSGYVQVGVVFDGRAIAQVDEVYLQ